MLTATPPHQSSSVQPVSIKQNTLQLAEERLSLAEGTLFDKRSDHYEWADTILYSLLGAMVAANPNLVENLKKAATPVRKPQTAYLLWLEENRPAIYSSLGGEKGEVKARELMEKAGEMWKSLSEEVKAEYKGKSMKAKEEYGAATKVVKTEEATQPSGKGKKTSASPPAPKKKGKGKVLGYHLFGKANRAAIAAEFPTLSVADTTRKVAEKWKEAPPSEKKKYEDQATEANAASGDTGDEQQSEPPAKRQRKPSAKKAAKDSKDATDEPMNDGAKTEVKTQDMKEATKKLTTKAAPKKADGKKAEPKKSDAKKSSPKKAEPKADKGKKAKPEDKDSSDAKKPVPKRKPGPKKVAKKE
ncbi:High mobility group protein DSP1 [Diplonema papillatum]|nr:High mobility group protein DSP1 [Diplonema papillatum]